MMDGQETSQRPPSWRAGGWQRALERVTCDRWLGLPAADWVCCGLLGLVGSAWVWRARLGFPLATPLWIFAFFLVLAGAGRLVCLALRLPSWCNTGFPTALVCGFFPVGLLFTVLRVTTGASFTLLSGMLLAGVGSGFAYFRRQLGEQQPDASSNAMAVAVTLLAATAVTFRVAFFCFPALLEEGSDVVIKMGDNEFHHAGFVTFLDAPGLPWKMGSQNLAERPALFYHFASYAAAAWWRAMTGATSLAALFGLMTPLGILLEALAAYSLASSWFQPRVGFWSVALFFGLPDPSILSRLCPPLQQGEYTSPLLVLPGAPANAYGLANALFALWLVTMGCKTNRTGLIGLGLTAALATALWKAQIGVNVCLALGLLLLPRLRQCLHWRAIAPPVLLLLLIFIMSRSLFDTSRVPTTVRDPTWGRHLAEWHLGVLPPTSWYHRLGGWALASGVPALLARIVLHALASFGLVIVAWLAVAAYVLVRQRRLNLPMAVGGASLVVYLSLGVLLAENRTGFRFEMQFSPYLLPLLLLEILLLEAVMSARLVRRMGRKPVPLALGFLCSVPLLLLTTFAEPDQTIGMPFPRALGQSAEFIRRASDPFDIVQDSAGDPSALLAGLTERRTYVGLVIYKQFLGATDIVRAYNERLALNEQLLQTDSLDGLRDVLRQCHIRWYVLWPDAHPPWPAVVLNSPVFKQGGFRVFDFHRLSTSPPDAAR